MKDGLIILLGFVALVVLSLLYRFFLSMKDFKKDMNRHDGI